MILRQYQTDLIERVARAIADASGTKWDQLPASHGPGYPLRQMYLAMARAAIDAMQSDHDNLE